MARIVTILATVMLAVAFAWGVPFDRLMRAFQPTSVALSIVTAAVFVRLNRGMPTLDWKSISQIGRERLTSQIVILTREYTYIVGLNSVFLILIVAANTFDATEAARISEMGGKILSAGFGTLTGLCLCRMAYVVWRDYDIVKLQKALIDASGLREQRELETKSAGDNVLAMKAANLRRVENSPPRAWPE